MSDWREIYQRRQTTPAGAAALVQSGDIVQMPILTPLPKRIADALAARAGDLANVTIRRNFETDLMAWHDPANQASFRTDSGFLSPLIRPAYLDHRLEFTVYSLSGLPRVTGPDVNRLMHPDVVIIQVSPPDENGFCSFGDQLWYSRSWCQNARAVLAEVNPKLIRTYGQNYLHVSDVTAFVAQDESPGPLSASRAVPAEDQAIAEAIGRFTADLIRDGDCIQLGFGLLAGAISVYLEDKHDLGVHSEVIPAGVAHLLKAGAVTGRRKTVRPGRIVGTSVMFNPEDLHLAHLNPQIELWEAGFTNDPKVAAQNPGFTAINNALAVDLQGQVASESFGWAMYSGMGGLIDFTMGAFLSPGGRTIYVLPATAKRGAVTRIVPEHPAGQIISVSRTFVDYVVTEFGVAHLTGKTERQRANEMINIAHPDYQGELKKVARERWG